MAGMASIVAVGQLGFDAKSGTSTNGNEWARATLSYTRPGGEGKEDITKYVNLVRFGKGATAFGKLKKGTWISVTGEPGAELYEPEGKQARANLQVIVLSWDYAGNTKPAASTDDDSGDDGNEAHKAATAVRGGVTSKTSRAPVKAAAEENPIE